MLASLIFTSFIHATQSQFLSHKLESTTRTQFGQTFSTSSPSSVYSAAITPDIVQANTLTVSVSVVVTLLAAVGILMVAVVAAIIFWRLRRRKSTITASDSAADAAGFAVENELLYGL